MARAPAQQGVVVDRGQGEHVVQAAGQARAAGGEEAAHLGLDRRVGVELAQPVGQHREVVGEAGGERVAVLEVAGRQVGVGHVGERGAHGPLDEAAPGAAG